MSTPVLAPSARSPRPAAVVFTDVVGYSTRMQRDESGTIALVRADFERMRNACLRHGGKVALLRLHLCRLDEAIDYLTAIGKQRPLSPFIPIRSIVARYYRDGDLAQAKRAVDEWRAHHARKPDDLLLGSLELRLAWLEGPTAAFDKQLTRYPQNCLEDTGFPVTLSRIACSVPFRLGKLAVLGRRRELQSSAEPSRLAIERELADSTTIVDRNERSLMLARAYAFTGDRQRALSTIAELQPRFERRQHEVFENNRYLVDLAIGWFWAGDRGKALEVLSSSLDAKGGTFATVVARARIWCPPYDDACFARVLQTHGQQIVKRPGACSAKRWRDSEATNVCTPISDICTAAAVSARPISRSKVRITRSARMRCGHAGQLPALSSRPSRSGARTWRSRKCNGPRVAMGIPIGNVDGPAMEGGATGIGNRSPPLSPRIP